MEKIIIYIDGGARGNPGPAACAAVFTDQQGRLIKDFSQYLGTASNNEAEYRGFILALKKAKALWGKAEIKKKSFEVFSDSELLVSQLNGGFKVKEPKIQQLFIEAWNLKVDFTYLAISLIEREKNRQADRLVNQTIEAQLKKQHLF